MAAIAIRARSFVNCQPTVGAPNLTGQLTDKTMKPASLIVLGITGAAALGVVAVLASVALKQEPETGLLAWQDPEIIGRGAKIYRSECSSCHGGLDGSAPAADAPEPSAPPHDENGHSWKHPDYVLFGLTKSGEVAELCLTGNGDVEMPEFAEALNDRQILDVLSYIKSTWPEEVRARQEATNQIYAAQNAATRELLENGGS
ncbi:Cytochrome c, mono- and diheme variants [Pseudooceanicola antarcticus]|uniref:Cytochrome c, mono- and diheme variants n=2 Tax=Pseudooceanicola antarcticus TaxID=1247613 RepID=A0A285IWF4_9RHOB|nr:Cytochrome c, mono- and diheme variants [Pseudooceanicola antarcticus]